MATRRGTRVGTGARAAASMAIAAALALAGCGDDASGTGGGGDAGQGGGGGQGGSGQGAGGQGGDGTGGQGGDGGGAVSCESEDAEPVAVVIRNDSSARIWFQQSMAGGQASGALGGITVDGEGPPDCACDALEACSMGASVSTTIGYLDPGGSFEATWSGLFHEDPASRPACQELPCSIGVAAPDGEHVMRAVAYRDEPFCDATCACDLALDQTCNFGEAAGSASDEVAVTATFELPAAGPVTLAFTD